MKLLQDMREVLKKLNRRKSLKKYCPKCESPDIQLSHGAGHRLTSPKYVCKKCGYCGPVFMELEKEEE